jgi:putative DNA methylase
MKISTRFKSTKKLIEVALPLEAINQACVDEKFVRIGHPANLHQWWSRKPLAAARAVLFASLVDDPSEYLSDENDIEKERERLFHLIGQLIQWKNSSNNAVLEKARLEIARSLARQKNVPVPVGQAAILEFLTENAPTIMDPFAGGGSIPLEAQRLGLQALACDLNPVAVMINKAMVEIPARFTGQPAVHSIESSGQIPFSKKNWNGIQGLVEDFAHYGQWVQNEAERRLEHLYPKAKLPAKYGGGSATVVAWIWAHTIQCPNPACRAEMPLVSKWQLSKKKGKETWVQPIIDWSSHIPKVEYTIASGKGNLPEGTVNRRGAKCLACEMAVSLKHVREEASAGRLATVMIAVAASGHRSRIYLEPDEEQIQISESARPDWQPEQEINEGLAGNVTTYGYGKFGDLFLPRQLVAINTYCELIHEVHSIVEQDAFRAEFSKDDRSLSEGGCGARAYADAIVTYLSFVLSKTLNRSNAFVPWGINVECPVNLFSRQTIAFIWDFAESNVVSGPSGSFSSMLGNTVSALETLDLGIQRQGTALQIDAVNAGQGFPNLMISTDPPYYDVISYSDLSDFFFVWLRKLLAEIYPDLFATMLTPKSQELVADPIRAGGKDEARAQFEEGMFQAFSHFKQVANPDFPMTVYYAYRQTEEKKSGQKVSTGWETILTGMINAGFVITGTWPIRTERAVKIASHKANVLASSIVLVCRPRSENAPSTNRRDFINALNQELPPAMKRLQQGNIAPVDLAQASIGPGMAVFSRYKQVLEADGSPMDVREALTLINQALDAYLSEQEGDYDSDTRWALAWFEQYGYDEGPFGTAEILSKAKNINLDGLVKAGILEARSGKVRLLRREELKQFEDSQTDLRPSVWNAVHYLIHELDKNGEQPAAELLKQMGTLGDAAHSLAYRIYSYCEKKKWTQEAMACNMLIVAWPRLKDLASSTQASNQGCFFERG